MIGQPEWIGQQYNHLYQRSLILFINQIVTFFHYIDLMVIVVIKIIYTLIRVILFLIVTL